MKRDPRTGAPVAVDTTTYRPSKAMRRYLRYVDGTCRFPGCRRAARHCDLDHTTAYAFGGRTQCENLSHLCPKHHRLKHQTSWQVTRTSTHTLQWTSPGGRTHTSHPDILLAVPDPPPPEHASAPQPPKTLPPRTPVAAADDPPPF